MAIGLNNLLASSSSLQSARAFRELDTDIRLQAQQRAAARGNGDTVITNIDYTVGPDGQLYASGGTVTSTRRTDREPDVASARSRVLRQRAQDSTLSDAANARLSLNAEAFTTLQQEQGNDIASKRKLSALDASVRSHERQHFNTAAGLTEGVPVYDLVPGPDGQFYAVGGGVNVRASGGSPEKQARDAATLARAATAPGDGSAQDFSANSLFLRRATGRYEEAYQIARNQREPNVAIAA